MKYTKEQITSLFDSNLRKLFMGRLTPQDPDFENISTLTAQLMSHAAEDQQALNHTLQLAWSAGIHFLCALSEVETSSHIVSVSREINRTECWMFSATLPAGLIPAEVSNAVRTKIAEELSKLIKNHLENAS